MDSALLYTTNSDNKSLINICRAIVGGASLPRLFPLNAQNAENEIALCVSDRNATFLFRNGITLTKYTLKHITGELIVLRIRSGLAGVKNPRNMSVPV